MNPTPPNTGPLLPCGAPAAARVLLGMPPATVPAGGQATFTVQTPRPVRLGKLRTTDTQYDGLRPLRVASITVGGDALIVPGTPGESETMPPIAVLLPKKHSAIQAEIAAWCRAHPDDDPDDAEIDEGGVSLDAMLVPGQSLAITLHNPTQAPIDVHISLDGAMF